MITVEPMTFVCSEPPWHGLGTADIQTPQIDEQIQFIVNKMVEEE